MRVSGPEATALWAYILFLLGLKNPLRGPCSEAQQMLQTASTRLQSFLATNNTNVRRAANKKQELALDKSPFATYFVLALTPTETAVPEHGLNRPVCPEDGGFLHHRMLIVHLGSSSSAPHMCMLHRGLFYSRARQENWWT